MNLSDYKQKLVDLAGSEEQFGKDTQPAHRGLADESNALEMELGNAIYDTIIKEKYQTIVLIGDKHGYGIAWVLLALEELNGRGKIYSLEQEIMPPDRQVWHEIDLPITRLEFLDSWSQLPPKIDFAMSDHQTHGLDLLSRRIRKGGQLVFHKNFSDLNGVGLPLRRFFAKPSEESKWMTYELPVGTGMFIAKRI